MMDARSGSATDAGVPAFLDHTLASTETSVEMRTQWRGGLRWIDSPDSVWNARRGFCSECGSSLFWHAPGSHFAYPRAF